MKEVSVLVFLRGNISNQSTELNEPSEKQSALIDCLIYKTEVDLHPDGDTFFPEYKRDEWREVARSDFAAQNNSFAYSYVQLDRI